MPTKKQLAAIGKKLIESQLDQELNAYFANPAQARIDYALPPPTPVVVKPTVHRPKSGMKSMNQKFFTASSLGTPLGFDNRLMNRVMANRPQGFAQLDIGFAVPKSVPKPVVTIAIVIQAKTPKKARKPRGPRVYYSQSSKSTIKEKILKTEIQREVEKNQRHL